MMLSLGTFVLMFSLISVPLLGTYRHVALSSPEVCPTQDLSSIPTSPSKVLELEEGAAMVLTLSNIRMPFWKCDLDVKASPGYGIMVKVEEATLRKNLHRQGKCTDYLQLGRDDKVPFFTWDKSAKLCGDVSGFSYEVKNGQLLVWVRLGEWQGVEQSELSIVITQYRSKVSADLAFYRACNSGSHWVSQEYFCDGRINCALDESPADESPLVCKEGEIVEDGNESSSPSFPSGPPLNLLSITLVLVTAAVLMILLVLLIIRLKASNNCTSRSSLSPECELPERAARVATVATIPQTTAILYLEPTATTSLVRGTTPDTEPPPAYQDLFPADFKFGGVEASSYNQSLPCESDEGKMDNV